MESGKLHIHATAPTNVAVCELARRCHADIFNSRSYSSSSSDIEERRIRPADMVIVGNTKRLKIQADGEEGMSSDDPLFSLLCDERVKRLKTKMGQMIVNVNDVIRMLRNPLEEDNELESWSSCLKKKVSEILSVLNLFAEEAPDSLRLVDSQEYSQQACQQIVAEILSENNAKLDEWAQAVPPEPSSPISMAITRLRSMLMKVHFPSKVLNEYLLKEEILNSSRIVFSTVNVAGRSCFGKLAFDVVVLDEATQLVQAETAIVLRRSLRCVVLAGDEKQLPATVMSTHCVNLGYSNSLFARLLDLGYPHHLLDTQYRMHPAISRWPSSQFYEGRIRDGENVLSEEYTKDWHSIFPPLSVYNLSAGKEEVDEYGSKFNNGEATLCRFLVNRMKNLKTKLTVGIISPYKAQIQRLVHLENINEVDGLTVRVCTIDSFQGQECDIILFTCVRSNHQGTIGFLKDPRRLNVAITRAKFALILVCSVATVSSNPLWADLLGHAGNAACILHEGDSPLIKRCADKVLLIHCNSIVTLSTARL